MFPGRSFGVVVLFCAAIAGCRQPYFITQLDYTRHNAVVAAPDPIETEIPETVFAEPRTIAAPSRADRWELSLEDARRIALQNNKRIKVVSYLQDDGISPGRASLPRLPRVSSPLAQARAGVRYWQPEIERRLAEFDTFFEIGGAWQRLDRQSASLIETGTQQSTFQQDAFGSSIGSGAFGINQTGGADTDGLSRPPTIGGPTAVQLGKRNATGGQTVFGYRLDYQRDEPVTTFTSAKNPFWRSSLELSFQQPLLQGAGVEHNRARILIARAFLQEQIKEFERNVHALVLSVEQAYWQLYFAYYDLYSREVGVEQALITWQQESKRRQVGPGTGASVAQAAEQYHFFLAARQQAESRLLSAEQSLRQRLGLPPDDGRQIVPSDAPTIAEYKPNWSVGVKEAMDQRPELAGQRFTIRAGELELQRQKNGLLPDLTLTTRYTITGLDDELDQSIDRLTDNTYTDWYLGIRYRRQVGGRSANTAVRRAQLELSQERAALRDLEHSILADLKEAFELVINSYTLIQTQHQRRLAAADQLQAHREYYRIGRTRLNVLLEAQTAFADAMRDESQAIAQYNQALILWEHARGTILQSQNVVIAESTSEQPVHCLAADINQWSHGLPLPIHSGDPVQDDEESQAEEKPLYDIKPSEHSISPEGIAPPATPATKLPMGSVAPSDTLTNQESPSREKCTVAILSGGHENSPAIEPSNLPLDADELIAAARGAQSSLASPPGPLPILVDSETALLPELPAHAPLPADIISWVEQVPGAQVGGHVRPAAFQQSKP